ncbi:uncharacterized protein LOC130627509 isoform X1 [Hydractinia symbiolongicarpus]|uniref:uncharacterized protein LOC130627509 isoform X1 n=1 Tax=Hydractinia symbiolongicarpus TaxID=13093 RepID=UPI00254B7031|nr:uncharacterized protein LOC130627509 isoform X1 [Hydractinia symbiolongicarpus]
MITQQQPISYATPVHTKVPRNIFIIGVVLIFTGDLTLGLSVSIFGELQIKWVPINQHGLSVLISVWIVVTGVLALYICRNSQSQRLVAIYRIIAMIGVILTFIAAVASAVGFVVYLTCQRKTRYDSAHRYVYSYFPEIHCNKNRYYGIIVHGVLFVLHFLQILFLIAAAVFGFELDQPGQPANPQIFQIVQQPTVPQTNMFVQDLEMTKPQQHQNIPHYAATNDTTN